MWKEPEPDPGGDTQEGASSGKSLQELSDLKDQNEQQQLLIAQLKEMLRKEQSNVTQEKVEEYINTLSKAKAKKNRARKDESGSIERSVSSSSSSVDIAKKQKLNLLRQQLEENKARLAERGKNQKGIEEMVNQLKAQLNDSQQLIPSNISIIEPKNLEYSKDSTQEELYNILLTKERIVTDLLNKVQRQEATIIDLEENLKEKDSVIDARTKAITLMTDSLSKKGKSTLDALDDTKEQMRKMQENFITLESEMKARQVKLLNDLKTKNLEIAELQETNQTLLEEKAEFIKTIEVFKRGDTEESHEIEKYKKNISDLQKQLDQMLDENTANLSKISELDSKLQDSLHDLNRLKNTGQTVGTDQSNDEEITKLRKQLEDNNKNMIKVKAQSKSKIKDLSKKLDQIKKANDANALIVQLQNENTKLSEKIAELEEEKGNMQLKMVESSESIKDSSLLEEHKELENKLEKYSEELEEKDKVISLLETEIIVLKEEINSLNEKISCLSHLENIQVSTEMNSIHLEEQLEKVERENMKLREEIDELLRKKEEMTVHIEELKKEKHEINSKLDNYIQENMDLIDKLEKLSAEKVSSAESIEIVEGLTQQEKIELAAYQKNLDMPIEGEPTKCSEDDHIEPPIELNESVLQLSEDSTELLQKIDMFNMERKEVMTKMEALKEDNNLLNLKLKEIENNRDVLAETYEQIQTEKEVLQNENSVLVVKLQELERQTTRSEEELKKVDNSESVTLAKLQGLQREYEELLGENKVLKHTIKEYDMHIHEKHKVESDLKEAKEKIEDLETKIHINLEEITNYQSVIEENKNELINSANLMNNLQAKLDAREKDVSDLNVIINDLNGVVSSLQNENIKLGNFELMESQVTELKTALDDQIQQAQEYEEEISRNNSIVNDLNSKFIEVNKKIIETEHEMEMKDIEYKKLIQDVQGKDELIQKLQQQVEEKDKKVSGVIQEMREKYLSLQKQLDGNSGTLETKIVELTNKNKEQMDKMKKIAANLKKKSHAYQELEEKYNKEKEKWETEANEKESIISHSQDKITSIFHQLKELEEEVHLKNAKLTESDAAIRELTQIIHNLEQNKAELQNSITELKHREQKLTEVSLKQELSTSLHEEFDNIPSNQESAKEEKIKELELIIETNEADIAHYTDRINKLEENIAQLEQEKEVLVQQTIELSDQLNATSKSVQEKSFMEEELGQKLMQVTANDEAIMKKLEEVTEDNRGLIQKNRDMEEMNLKLKVKLKKAHERVAQLKTLQANVEELENVNNELKKQLAILEANQKHIQDENMELQKQNQNDYEKIEADCQIQLEELVKCRNELTVECEKLQESLKDMVQREEDLLSEIAEYKQKMEENEANNKERSEELAEEARVAVFNWKDSLKEIEALNQQIQFLEKELIFKMARETVESIVTEAEDRIRSMRSVSSQTDRTEILPLNIDVAEQSASEFSSVTSAANRTETVATAPGQQEIVPTFHWPDAQQSQQTNQTENWFTGGQTSDIQQTSSTDWFNTDPGHKENVSQLNLFPHPDPQRTAVVENSKEELLNKIKTLEFLLYNIDKEKEEAFQECTGMVNELTRLVYEKVNPNTTTLPPPAGSTSESRRPLTEIESQIMSATDITDAASNKKELQTIEFEKTDASLGEQSHPVIEEVMQPTRAYLTYQPDDKIPGNVKPELFGENDDGWGWGPEEAKLEEEHQFRAESTPQVQNLRNEIARLNEALQVLQMERENHLEEIKQLQVKSGKLIKKCRELKQKNDQIMEKQQNKKAEGADFMDLDAAIQEELKTQITQLEKKVKEVTNELEKEKQEKTNILKRVDVLTSANERMIEMKEIQDAEVLRWKRKHEEVEEKLQQYEWGSDGFNEGSKPKSSPQTEASPSSDRKKIEELHQTIKELSLDNEELQALLEEQRQLRMNLEKAKTPPENDRLEEERKKLSELEDKMKSLEQELTIKTDEIQKILNDRNSIYAQKEELENLIKAREENIIELKENLKYFTEKSNEYERLLADSEKLVKDLQESEKNDGIADQVKKLEFELFQLNQLKAQQDQLLHEKETAFNELVSSFEQISLLKEELNIQVKQLTNDLEQQRQKYNDLEVQSSKKISELQSQLTHQEEQFDKLKMELDRKISNLCSDLEEQKQINDHLQADATTRINHLSQELEKQNQKYERLHAEYIEKTAELTKISQQLQRPQQGSSTNDPFEWVQEKYQLESLLAEKEATSVELRKQNDNLEKQIQDLKQQESAVREPFEWAQEKYQLESLLAEKEASSAELKKQNDNLEKQIQDLKQQGSSAREPFEWAQEKYQLESLLAEKEPGSVELKKQNDNLEKQVQDLKQQGSSAREPFEWAQEKYQLESLLAEKEPGSIELKKQNDNLEKQVQDLTQQGSSAREPFEWAQEKYQLESLLAEKEATSSELKKQNDNLEKQIQDLQHILEEKQKDYEQLLSETEEKIFRTVKELEENWIIQVDQRGADVAESWKLHLESVEAEFASVQEKLKFELNELEEKCNVLVNENNELRKNVDAEIRNEVDRISALQQQITDCQRYITELNNKLTEKQNENENLMGRLTALEREKEQLASDVRDKDGKLASLSIIVDTTQKQFDEKREVVEEIVRILEKNTAFPISFEKEDVLNEFLRQLNLLTVKEQEIQELNKVIENLHNQLSSVQEKEGEIFRLNQLVQDLQKQLDLLREKDEEISRLNALVEESQNQLLMLHEKDEELLNMNRLVEDLQRQFGSTNGKEAEINRLNNLVTDLQGQLSLLDEKDGEIYRLNQIIENYKFQQELSQEELNKLRQEQTAANVAIEGYKQKLEEFSSAYFSLQSSLEEKNQLIATLNQQLQLTESLKSDNREVEELQEEISQLKNDCSMLQQSLAECQEQLFSVNNELTNKTDQLENVNQQLAYSQQNFEIQEGELNKLKNLLQSTEQEYSNSVDQLKRTHLRDLENHYEELLAAKDLDIEAIRSQLIESIQNLNLLTEKVTSEGNLRQQLQSKIKELEAKIIEQATLLEEEDKQLTEMRSIIEQQVIKIEELKKELFVKSSDYDSLIAEMDIGRKTITQQPTHSALVEKPVISERTQLLEDDLSEPVSRAELDLALYMLHQRDVRCEELTVELTQLLEERDTLQLRLSNALREKEDIRRRLTGPDGAPVPSTSTSPLATPLSKSSASFFSASEAELAAEQLDTSSGIQNLQSKLSELKRVGYKKDKTFVDEQEFRRVQQMSIMQQHINEASKLPPEAAAKLVDASYTLSRDVQSPSKVLLNWLWGRSTPKVNDT